MKHGKKLREIIEESPDSIAAVVAQDCLYSENAETYLSDLLQHGCQSGIVSGLIYYTDTKDFFIRHMEEIDELRGELEDSLGEPLKIGTPAYNWLAWFGYEETARKLAEKLGIEA